MPVRWAWGQLTGWFANFRDLVTDTSPLAFLAPSIRSTVVFLGNSLPKSLGFTDGPQDHVVGVVVFATFLVLASFTVLTSVAIVYALVFGPLALLRLYPAVEQRWPIGPEDWPFWGLAP